MYVIVFCCWKKNKSLGGKVGFFVFIINCVFFLEFIYNVFDLIKNNRGEGIVIFDVNDFFLLEN